MKKKSTKVILLILLVIIGIGVCVALYIGGGIGDSLQSADAGVSGGGEIHLSSKKIKTSGKGMKTSDGKVTISKGGTYVVDGSMEEGQIYVDAGDEDVVTLTLNGVTISNTEENPIHVENAAELVLASDSDAENKITAGNGTQVIENKTVKQMTQIAAVYSKDDITIESGVYTITASGDGVHGNDDVRVKGGTVSITCGDDGIHANEKLKIKDGTITVLQSYEGLEANQIEISGGNHNVTAKDDGINANGGTTNTMPNPNTTSNETEKSEGSEESEESEETETMPNLTISGGTLYVNAQGDGLDSNGNLTISGGETIVDGPSNDGNGALDSGSESGGVCKVEGGTILAVGSSGMAESFDDSQSTQYSFLHNLDSHFAEGTEIKILDEKGNELFSHTAARTGNSIVFSSGELEKGKTYTISVGDEKTDVTLDSMTTSNGTYATMGGFGGGGRNNGQPMKK
jgi:hypothetical protein